MFAVFSFVDYVGWRYTTCWTQHLRYSSNRSLFDYSIYTNVVWSVGFELHCLFNSRSEMVQAIVDSALGLNTNEFQTVNTKYWLWMSVALSCGELFVFKSYHKMMLITATITICQFQPSSPASLDASLVFFGGLVRLIGPAHRFAVMERARDAFSWVQSC